MEVIGEGKLNEFGTKHGRARRPLDRWVKLIKSTRYSNLINLRNTFNDPDDIGNGLIIFNISGNKFRLVALLDFVDQIVQVEKIMTHEEYNKWNKRR